MLPENRKLFTKTVPNGHLYSVWEVVSKIVLKNNNFFIF